MIAFLSLENKGKRLTYAFRHTLATSGYEPRLERLPIFTKSSGRPGRDPSTPVGSFCSFLYRSLQTENVSVKQQLLIISLTSSVPLSSLTLSFSHSSSSLSSYISLWHQCGSSEIFWFLIQRYHVYILEVLLNNEAPVYEIFFCSNRWDWTSRSMIHFFTSKWSLCPGSHTSKV